MTDVRITSDPSTASSRVYVGGVMPEMPRSALDDYFSKYGEVLAIAVYRGYGFVQFAKDEEAQAALKDGANKTINGTKLTLKTAVKNKQFSGNDEDHDGGFHDGPFRGGPRGRGGPFRGGPFRGRGRGRGGGGPHGPHGPHGGPHGPHGPHGPPPFRDEFDGPPDHRPDFDGPPGKRPRGPPRDWSPPPGGRGGRDGRGGRRPYDDYEDEDYHRRYRGGPPGYDERDREPPPYMRPRSSAVEDERANDCEIVVLDRKNRPYAEEVEDRLKNVGLAVDMLFPRTGAPINQVLDQISSRGTLYAVVVHPTNEQHRSVSLNIMHGNPPQEHRNMPLDDAMSLVARNFEAYMLSNKDKAPPQGIINLLNFVRENRPLTAVEYNRLIRYLEEKRDHQLKPDKSSLSALSSALAPKPVPAPVVSVATPSQQQIDLQQKILSMMQAYKTQQPSTLGVGAAPVTVPVPAPVLAPTVQTWPGADQSRVKSAIDSLVTSGPNLLKLEQESQQQQQYAGGYGYGAQQSSLGQAPANPLFGAYANQRY